MPCSMQIVAARSAAYSLPMPPKSISMPARGRRTASPFHSTRASRCSGVARRQRRASGSARRHGAEIPRAPQHAGRDVEAGRRSARSTGRRSAAARRSRRRWRTGDAARGRVDARGDAVVAIARILRLDPRARRRSRRRPRVRARAVIRRPQLQLVLRAPSRETSWRNRSASGGRADATLPPTSERLDEAHLEPARGERSRCPGCRCRTCASRVPGDNSRPRSVDGPAVPSGLRDRDARGPSRRTMRAACPRCSPGRPRSPAGTAGSCRSPRRSACSSAGAASRVNAPWQPLHPRDVERVRLAAERIVEQPVAELHRRIGFREILVVAGEPRDDLARGRAACRAACTGRSNSRGRSST